MAAPKACHRCTALTNGPALVYATKKWERLRNRLTKDFEKTVGARAGSGLLLPNQSLGGMLGPRRGKHVNRGCYARRLNLRSASYNFLNFHCKIVLDI